MASSDKVLLNLPEPPCGPGPTLLLLAWLLFSWRKARWLEWYLLSWKRQTPWIKCGDPNTLILDSVWNRTKLLNEKNSLMTQVKCYLIRRVPLNKVYDLCCHDSWSTLSRTLKKLNTLETRLKCWTLVPSLTTLHLSTGQVKHSMTTGETMLNALGASHFTDRLNHLNGSQGHSPGCLQVLLNGLKLHLQAGSD